MRMHSFSLLAGILMFAFNANAQNADNWFVDKVGAIEFAKKNDAKVLLVFAGSDWCRPCIQLKKDVLESEQFVESTSDKLAILYLDFPARKKNKLNQELTLQNESFAEKFNASGSFPKLVLLDSSLKKIKDISYDGESQSELLKLINE